MNNSKIIYDYLIAWINNHENQFDIALPSENFLKTKFNISRGTIRNQFIRLVNKGYLINKQGSGYYINLSIDFVKLSSIGDATMINNDVYEIDIQYIDSILKMMNFTNKINKGQYFGYCKIFGSKEKNSVYSHSFILKEAFNKIDLEEIKESLIGTIFNNNNTLKFSINECTFSIANDEDRRIFQNNQELTPVVYGVLITEDNKAIELFERRYSLTEFKQKWVKFF